MNIINLILKSEDKFISNNFFLFYEALKLK